MAPPTEELTPTPLLEDQGGERGQGEHPRPARAPAIAPERLNDLSDAELLDLRLCDLPLRLDRSELRHLVRQLHREMRARGLVFQPPCYLSTEWFVDKGETSIALPFYLAHPRLVRLERRMVIDVEGENPEEAMRILRHEAGHAVDYAYGIHSRRGRQRMFGTSSTPYPEAYVPKPYSRSFVRHIENWYAQSHPDEDWAETFAVWLRPHSEWRQRYRNWRGALRKLEYMDQTMTELAGVPPKRISRRRPWALRTLKQTLREFYAERVASLDSRTIPEYMDADLQRIFSPQGSADAEPAHRFIRRNRRVIRDVVARWTGMKKYNADTMVADMMRRSRELKLFRSDAEDITLLNLAACCVSLSKNHLFAGQFSMSS